MIERDEYAYVNTKDADSARRFFGVPSDRLAEPIKGARPDELGRRVFRVKMETTDEKK